MSIYNQTNADNPKNVLVKVLSKDRMGLVGEITTVIAFLGADITSHNAKVYTNDKNQDMSMFEGIIELDGTVSLQVLLHRLHKIKGVVSVIAC